MGTSLLSLSSVFRRTISRTRAVVMEHFNLTRLFFNNVQVTSRTAPSDGHPLHSDSCLPVPPPAGGTTRRDETRRPHASHGEQKEDEVIMCNAANKSRHECCLEYHYSAVIHLTDGSDGAGGRYWDGSELYFLPPGLPRRSSLLPGGPRHKVSHKPGRMIAFTNYPLGINLHGVAPMVFSTDVRQGTPWTAASVAYDRDYRALDDVQRFQQRRKVVSLWMTTDPSEHDHRYEQNLPLGGEDDVEAQAWMRQTLCSECERDAGP